MNTVPTIAELSRYKSHIIICFAVCNVSGSLKVLAIVKGSRYDIGTSRPIEVRSWRVEFLPSHEFKLKGSPIPGSIVNVLGTDYLLANVGGGEIEISLADGIAVLREHKKAIEQQNVSHQEAMEQERIAQLQQDFDLKLIQQQQETEFEEQKRHKQQQLDYIECLTARKNRIARDFKLLKIFPELETFRAVLEQEHQAQAYFEKQSLYNVKTLANELYDANMQESFSLISMREKAQRLWQERQRQVERVRLANQKTQEEGTRRQIQEEERHKEKERLKEEQAQDVKKKERIEQNRLIHQRFDQEQAKRELKIRQHQNQKFQQELSQAQYTLLPSVVEVNSGLRGLKAFYPPSRGSYDAFIQQLKLLAISCQRHLNSSIQQTDKRVWSDILAELQKIETDCVVIANVKGWLRPKKTKIGNI